MLRKQLNAVKREDFPWMLEVTKSAPQEAIRALGIAYVNWFASLSGKRKGPKLGPPQFKRKFKRDSFKFDNFSVEGSRIRIPKLGWVRMREPLRFTGALKGATVSRTAVGWEVAILVETDTVPARSESQAAVGVDVGLHDLVVLSTGEKVPAVKALGGLLEKLRRLSRAHSRKRKGSANRRKSAQVLARLHYRIANVRKDALHKLSDRLTCEFGWIALEDLNVKGMLANGRLARHLADAGFGELRRQLTYKAQQRGVHLAVVDRWYPSSKTCNGCGDVYASLTLSERTWTCAVCGASHDRDVNAARNILDESIRTMAPGAGVTICGAGSADSLWAVNLPAVKQKIKHKMAKVPSYA